MNSKRLLAHFDRISEAPDAIPRLREFILDLAVRGQLVEHDPNDEPAYELLKRVLEEKGQPARKKAMNKVRPLQSFEEPAMNLRLPITWRWVRAGDLFRFVTSGSRGWAPYYSNDGAIFLRIGNLDYGTTDLDLSEIQHVNPPDGAEGSRTLAQEGDILISITGDTGMIGLVPAGFPEAYINQHIALARPSTFLHRQYLAMFFTSPLVLAQLRGSQRGIKNSLGLEDIRKVYIALPPLPEQHRIVAKVDELMALCERLEAAQAERERRRDRLAAASLQRLNQPADAPRFREHARFHLRHLPRLTTRPEHIQQLRQTILNLAVRGKLIPQDPNDEPAIELLNRSERLEKPSRYASRSSELIRGDCGLSVGNPKTPLPSGWTRVPMIEIARLESGHTPSRSRPDWWGGEIPWIGLVDARLHHGQTISDTIQHTNPEGIANSAARVLPAGTVCFSRTASVGYVVVMEKPMATSQDFVNWVPTVAVLPRWLQLVLIAEKPALSRFSKGAVHQTIYYPAWLSMHILLPPISEQRRIVAKVTELLVLCDRIEKHLSAAHKVSGKFFEALLSQALTPEGRS